MDNAEVVEPEQTVLVDASLYAAVQEKHEQKRCEVDGCEKYAHKKGYCTSHAREHGVAIVERRCTVEGCLKQAQAYCFGYCIAHAKEHRIDRDPKSKTSRQCKAEGCEKYARRKGYCSLHGRANDITQAPPTEAKVCTVEGCSKWPRTGGLCTLHAREAGLALRRCKEEGCPKGPCKKGYCMVHARARGFYDDTPRPSVVGQPEVIQQSLQTETELQHQQEIESHHQTVIHEAQLPAQHQYVTHEVHHQPVYIAPPEQADGMAGGGALSAEVNE